MLQIGNGRCSLAVLIQKPNSEPDQAGWVVTRTLHAWQHFYFRLKEVSRSRLLISLSVHLPLDRAIIADDRSLSCATP